MRIAYVHSGLWPSKTPSITFAAYNVIGLSKNAGEVFFYVQKNSSMEAGEVLETEFGIRCPENLVIRQVERPFFRTNRLYYRKIANDIIRRHQAAPFDAVMTRSLTFLPYLERIGRSCGIPVYFETHDFFSDLKIRDVISGRKKIRQNRIERRYIPRLSGLICLQEAQKELYRRIYPGVRIEVARTGIHSIVRSGRERRYVTYIGSLDRLKGVDLFIDALARTNSRPDVLIIGGKSAKEIDRLKGSAGRYYPSEKIQVTGWVGKETVDALLKESLIGILPLKDTFFNRFVTSPLKLFDYFSYGVPVIASDLPSTRELIAEGATGCFFRAGDAAGLAEKIDDLVADRDRIERMSENIYSTCGKYLWEKRGKQIIDMIRADNGEPG